MNRDIESLVKGFVDELEGIFTKRNKEQVNELIASLTNGRKQVTPKGRILSGKRSPEELEKLQGKLKAYVEKNPGQRCEEIAKGMGTTTDDLALPLRKINFKTQGKARGRRYWVR